ncbi:MULTISPECIES: sensor histidine kinase [unclassified Chryseobacterium]|uniref:sensor histidine kinase n=1 Tax=unclassified Chryseobacterium TaxID=2593645 RepID=UPI00100B75C7|nr:MULTISPECIES: sensor histidine kinase [unclassified Chryseobacterium]RXM49708.1 histidine kinase [Chryseobacterium sp. CH25]RXM61857.1 histidine kinase [Chryseobacterium sp. CH1]
MGKLYLNKKTEAGLHILFWLLTLYFMLVGKPLSFEMPELDLFFKTYAIVFVLTFYFNYMIVMPRIFKDFEWIKLLAGIIITYLFFTLTRFVIEQVLTDWWLGQVNYTNPVLGSYLMDNLAYSSKPIIFSSFLWLIVHVIRLLEYNKVILEEQKNTEIKFLKAQINPHFIFNTLNNIYSMVHFQSPESLSAIEKLSNIMRFTTYEAQKEHIALSEELDYIKAYIELEELRHYENNIVKWQSGIKDEKQRIAPYILSPLIENALKHGAYSEKDPIEININSDDKSLNFEVINSIGNKKTDKLGGIGLDNLKNRLDMLYHGKYKLETIRLDNKFKAFIQIQLL